eukprot:TRINITY_DN126_c0_g2_i3.p1 TRINITY_DN126_c0_g2~~TRINITY_DN126_c0_g2_i3.p1  ORF type:complete len:718 (+),score=188.63 TRINITY_DN126_c0_g2_i3:67-2220(+)
MCIRDRYQRRVHGDYYMGCTGAKDEPKKKEEKKSEEKEDATAEKGVTYSPQELGIDKEETEYKKKERPPEPMEDNAELEQMQGEHAAVDKTKGVIIPPTNPPPIDLKAPKVSFVPHYVYGYRGYDCRQNLFFSDEGKLIYHIAAVGIILDPESNTQQFFGGKVYNPKAVDQHIDDILCLGVSIDGKLAVSGEIGPKPSLFIWKTANGELVKKHTLTIKNPRGIKCCAFSAAGDYVAFVDKSDKFNIHVLSLSDGKIAWTEPTGGQEVYGIAWSKNKDEHLFATCGDKHITFWDVDTKKPHKGTGHGAQTFLSISFDDKGVCYAGAANGNLYSFDKSGKIVGTIEKAHAGAVQAVVWKEGKLITAGMDMAVNEINMSTKKATKLATLASMPKAIDIQGNKVVIGDKSGNITLFNREGEQLNETKKWISHKEGELWGIEVTDKEVITTCDDNKIIVWDYNNRKDKAFAQINEKAEAKLQGNASTSSSLPDNQCSRAVCFNKQTNEIAIGTNSGEVQIRKIEDVKTTIKTIPCSKRWIESMMYSPDGNFLAVGTHSNTVCIYKVPEYELFKEYSHPSSIIGLDWNEDSKFIRSLDEGMGLIFWNMDAQKIDENGPTNCKDTAWFSHNLKLSWHVMGVYPSGVQFSNVNGIARSPDSALVVTGDDWGLVNIYNYPATKGAKCIQLRGHSEHVVRIRFSPSGEYLFSIGGQDKALILSLIHI